MLQNYNVEPVHWPDAQEREAIFNQCHTPSNIREHGCAVAEKALSLARQLTHTTVNNELLAAACHLHDLARHMGKMHAQQGAEILRIQGYPEVAKLVETHHDLPPSSSVEAELLYLADKLIQGIQEVSLEARFAAAEAKCQSQQAKEACRRRHSIAKSLIKQYHLCVG